ncbi:MAG: Hpt domain-containing protein [Hyphomicrobiaceae bacterium]|nr:Hpt domain-containing protein [Hyphomicrobiaceae bacterium]
MAVTTTTPAYPRTGEAPLDLAYLSRFTLGNHELEQEVLELFSAQAPLYLERLAAAECPKSWGQAAHTLKGSALAVGANEVGRLALAAEQEGFAAEPERRRRRVQELEAAVDRVVTFIAEVLAAR